MKAIEDRNYIRREPVKICPECFSMVVHLSGLPNGHPSNSYCPRDDCPGILQNAWEIIDIRYEFVKP